VTDWTPWIAYKNAGGHSTNVTPKRSLHTLKN